MKCEQCGELLHPVTGSTYETTVGQLGVVPPGHEHDNNCLSRFYVCKNGHRVHFFLRRRCPACDWRGKETCFCHEGKKLDRWPEDDIPAELRVSDATVLQWFRKDRVIVEESDRPECKWRIYRTKG